jgi:hypothetical protein
MLASNINRLVDGVKGEGWTAVGELEATVVTRDDDSGQCIVMFMNVTDTAFTNCQIGFQFRPFIFFFLIKPTRCTNFTNVFCHETLHVSNSSSVYHQEFIHCTLSSGMCQTAFEQDHDGNAVPSWSCSKSLYKPV